MPKKVAVVLGVIFGLEDGARQNLIKQKQDSSMVTDRLPYESSSGQAFRQVESALSGTAE